MHKRSRTAPFPDPLSTPFVEASIRLLLSVNEKCPKLRVERHFPLRELWTPGRQKFIKPGLDKPRWAAYLRVRPGFGRRVASGKKMVDALTPSGV